MKSKATCIDCRSEAVSTTVTRLEGKVVLKEQTFGCGARLSEFANEAGGVGRIEFEGCTVEL